MQGLININGRQRIVLVSNMPESENVNGKQYSIDTISANHPNAIFFTEKKEYNGENIGNNIWMGGVNFTRVHGVDPNACSISIGDELITLIFDPKTGLISLKSGSKISTIHLIGFLNYKDNDTVDNSMNDEIWRKMLIGEKMIFASPVNKVALYFQFTPLAPNGSTLPSDPSQNTISVPDVKIESTGKFVLYPDRNYVEYMPNDPEIGIIRSYIQANRTEVYIDNRLPVYKYTFNIINTGVSKTDDLNITPLTLKSLDSVRLSAFGQSSDGGTSVIKRDETSPNKFYIEPIDYLLAIHSTNVVYRGSSETSYRVNLKENSERTVELEYTVNNNDESGKNILNRDDIDSIIEYRFFVGNNNVTSQVLSNEFVEVIENENENENENEKGKLKIKFKVGFTRSSGFSALTVKAIPTSFNNNYTKYLLPISESTNPYSEEYKFNSSISNYKSFNLIFEENDNTIYAGVNPSYINNSYINLDNSSLTEQNIENLLFNNFNTLTCGNYEDMCETINNTSSENNYVPQGFDQVSESGYRNLFIVLPQEWASNIFITELLEGDNKIEASNGDTEVYLKASTITTQVGKYSIIKTIGSIVDPNNVRILPTSKWKEITI